MRIFAYLDPESGLELHMEPFGDYYTELDIPESLLRRFNAARSALGDVEDEILVLKRAAEAEAAAEMTPRRRDRGRNQATR